MQIGFLGYLSAMLPLVRPHEYLIIRSILDTPHTIEEINNVLSAEIKEYDYEQLMHAIEYMIASVTMKTPSFFMGKIIVTLSEFDERVWQTTLETATVYHDGRIVFRFLNGTEIVK